MRARDAPGARSGRRASARKAIVFVVTDFEPAVGGTTRQTGVQARALAGRGHDVVVLTRRLDRAWPASEQLGPVSVVRVLPAGRSNRAKAIALATTAWWLARHRRRIGVVQVIMDPDYALSAACAGLLSRTIVTWAARGDATRVLPSGDRPIGVKRRLRRTVLRRCRHVALTHAMLDELRTMELPDGRLIPVPVDTERFHPPRANEKERARSLLGVRAPFVIAYVGHLQTPKGVPLLLESFVRLVRSGRPSHLVLIGGTKGTPADCEVELRRLVARHELDGVVSFTGAVAHVERYLAAADVLVLPSFREGMPNCLIEAMACGIPCVAPPTAGGDEILANGAGDVPPSNDPAHLLAALIDLHDRPDRRATLATAGQLAISRLAPETVAATYEALYQEVGL